MLQRLIDDVKEQTGSGLRLVGLAVTAAVAVFITIVFLCAAAFVAVFQTYGLIPACLSAAALFLVVAVIAGGGYAVRKNQMNARAKERAKERARERSEDARSALQSGLADPRVIASGLQLARAIGIKRLLPILAVGGLALGFLASRRPVDDEAPAE